MEVVLWLFQEFVYFSTIKIAIHCFRVWKTHVVCSFRPCVYSARLPTSLITLRRSGSLLQAVAKKDELNFTHSTILCIKVSIARSIYCFKTVAKISSWRIYKRAAQNSARHCFSFSEDYITKSVTQMIQARTELTLKKDSTPASAKLSANSIENVAADKVGNTLS